MPSPDDLPGAPDPTTGGAATTAVDARRQRQRARQRQRRTGTSPRRPSGPTPAAAPRPQHQARAHRRRADRRACSWSASGSSWPEREPEPAHRRPRRRSPRPAARCCTPCPPDRCSRPSSSAGQPPDDLLDALALSRRASTPVPSSAINQGVESLRPVVALRGARHPAGRHLVLPGRAPVPALGADSARDRPAPTGTQYLILEQHPASDGLRMGPRRHRGPHVLRLPEAPRRWRASPAGEAGHHLVHATAVLGVRPGLSRTAARVGGEHPAAVAPGAPAP